jgi:hypothetical protein
VTPAKVYESIGTPDKASAWPSIVRSIPTDSEEAQSKFTALIEKSIGPHSFMIFHVPGFLCELKIIVSLYTRNSITELRYLCGKLVAESK